MKIDLNTSPTFQIIKEIFFEFINLLAGNIWNKIGLSILLIILSMVCIFSSVTSQNGEELDKPIIFTITGYVLLIVSLCLIGMRFKEIRDRNKNK